MQFAQRFPDGCAADTGDGSDFLFGDAAGGWIHSANDSLADGLISLVHCFGHGFPFMLFCEGRGGPMPGSVYAVGSWMTAVRPRASVIPGRRGGRPAPSRESQGS